MSLFHFQEWFWSEVPQGRTIHVSNLVGNRDQIFVGSLNGTLSIFDPGREPDNRQETALMLEKDLKAPVLNILVGKFLASYEEALVAVLHPRLLKFFRLGTVDNASFTLDPIFEHKLKQGPAFNMCVGELSRGQYHQIYVQSINCSLSIYEAENHVLGRQMQNAIHPGPIVYAASTQTLFNASGGYLTAYPHSSFTATLSNSNKKLMYEWTFNLGDTVVDMGNIDETPIQPSIIVLCRRMLYCFTHGGTPRFMLRFQFVCTSLLVYKSNDTPVTQYCVGTSTKTLLFYNDTTMVWSAQFGVIPIEVRRCNFTHNHRGMVTILSDDCRLTSGYLGTEPSIFRMPVTETRFIDFEARREEIENFEKTIKNASKDSSNFTSSRELEVKIQVVLDVNSVAVDTFEGATSATINVSVQSPAPRVDLVFHSECYSEPDNFTVTTGGFEGMSITTFVYGQPVADSRFILTASTSTGESSLIEGRLPLKLLCFEVGALRAAQHKLSLDTQSAGLEIRDLYPEFETESQSSLGLQPFGSEAVVSLFSGVKNGRYRIQSDSTDFLYLVFDDLVRRIKKKQPDAKLSCPVPLHMFVTGIVRQIELEKRREAERKEVDRVSIQMRHVETMLLNKLKVDRDESMASINVLVNYTYRELLTGLDQLKNTEKEVEAHRTFTLKPLLNLMKLVLGMSDINLPFDGWILDGNDQTLTQILAPLLGHVGSSADLTADGITQLIVAFCEQGGRFSTIAEMPEEEEEEKQHDTNDLVHLETGAMESSLHTNN
ncbi:unnamed protein product [Bursaphelenchus okinawaensis]|uniref:PTHB1 N-terminal domain-containing protein n=1 Tax=Bursaphelenchus okinawaensis TaxID=465554 RepID=A0A811JVG5_9BILA|nr:unnamed protein product [Bursaphelenchus okinawaensis]CAG9084964.1 unnamed protein product [Bursaphelenchus okinawaensis]